ncbi:MAG TPA: heterodisulfide reductase-related iron-sulfur binding cluster [Candidatus Baltobacteraceae bacterium]|nr:heterodisulfide reductase-related iron-sulfur binding cluster [Candidatus Baltobacteraceae bacterium]
MIDASVYNKCVRCGLCLPTCPTYVETLTETSGPRGRISLIKAVAEERLDLLSPGFVHQMSECLDCRACEAVCPSGVQYGQLVEAARSEIETAQARKRAPLARFSRWVTLDVLFGNLVFMRIAAALLRFYQRSGLRTLARKSGVLRMLHLEESEALAPDISRKFFVARNQRFAATPPRATVMLHAGCVMHVAFAHVDEATVRVLQRNGCTVLVPAKQGCCGAIAVHAGELDFGRELAKRNIVAFEESGADYYIINAAGCGSALKEYGHILRDDPRWADRAARFSSRVRDVLEFLDEIGISPELGQVDATVTYQDACHLAHAQRITAPPRRLLSHIPGLQLIEMNESSLCCGSAGIYNVTQPEMARRLGERKAANVSATGAQIVATANPGCAMQMGAHLREKNSPIRVKHVIELLDEAYENYNVAASRSRSFSAASSVP